MYLNWLLCNLFNIFQLYPKSRVLNRCVAPFKYPRCGDRWFKAIILIKSWLKKPCGKRVILPIFRKKRSFWRRLAILYVFKGFCKAFYQRIIVFNQVERERIADLGRRSKFFFPPLLEGKKACSCSCSGASLRKTEVGIHFLMAWSAIQWNFNPKR